MHKVRWMVLLLALAACKPQPPHIAEVCTESTVYIIPTSTFVCDGKGICSIIVSNSVVENCLASEKQCVVDDDYHGPETCDDAWAQEKK